MNIPALSGAAEVLRSRALHAVVLQDPDTIRFFTGVTGYLGMEFGRPTLLLVELVDSNEGCSPAPVRLDFLTPVCEAPMVERAAVKAAGKVEGLDWQVTAWSDDAGWVEEFRKLGAVKRAAGASG